jgi:hypothetical protein
MASGTQILAAQYVTIQDKAQSLLGTGAATRGYGQTVQSADVFTGNAITKAQWDQLRFDIINIRVHQNGTLPNIADIAVGDVIGFGAASPNNNYDALLEFAIANRFRLDTGQAVVTDKGSASYTSDWSNSLTATLTVTFSNNDEARYFFNSGGKIRFTPSLTGGTIDNAQYTAWVNILDSIGTIPFGADTDPFVTYYTLTDTFQTYYTSFASSPYSDNSYTLEARTNVADNSTGTATQLFLRVTLADDYVDPDVATGNEEPPGDLVDGTLTISVSELKAAGSLQPSGSFTITSPSYSLSAISGS